MVKPELSTVSYIHWRGVPQGPGRGRRPRPGSLRYTPTVNVGKLFSHAPRMAQNTAAVTAAAAAAVVSFRYFPPGREIPGLNFPARRLPRKYRQIHPERWASFFMQIVTWHGRSLDFSWSCLILFDRVQASRGRSVRVEAKRYGAQCSTIDRRTFGCMRSCVSVRCTDAATFDGDQCSVTVPLAILVRFGCLRSCLRWCSKNLCSFGVGGSAFTLPALACTTSLCVAFKRERERERDWYAT